MSREGVRVQKYLSQSGAASRRQAEALMRQGRVEVNGRPATEMGTLVVPGVDAVSLDGRAVTPAARRWLVFHKPVGTLCTRTDPHGGRTVYDVLPEWADGLRYVGRLDRDTSGLLLLTNDGDLAAALAHPRTRVEREYVVRLDGPVTARTLRALRRGVELEDGMARPRSVRRLRSETGDDDRALKLVLTEGRKREVRRLVKAVGREVTGLRRIRFGPFRLGRLAPGAWRPAHASELARAEETTRRRRGRAAGRCKPRGGR